MVAETTPTEQPMGPEDYGPLALQVSRAGGGRWERFVYSGPAGSRRYFVYTPAGYSLDQRVPMVVMLHGCTQSPADAAVGRPGRGLPRRQTCVPLFSRPGGGR